MKFGEGCWVWKLCLHSCFHHLFIIPESPRWLLLRGKVARSESIFGKIYSRKERAKKQVEELQAHIANETKSEFKYLFQPGILTAVVAGLCIAILGQFMGVNAVLYYGPTIFENVGLSGGDSLFYQVLIGAVNMGTTVLALLIIDKIGRKKLVYYGVSGMIVSLLLIAFYFSFGESLGLSSILMLIFSCCMYFVRRFRSVLLCGYCCPKCIRRKCVV